MFLFTSTIINLIISTYFSASRCIVLLTDNTDISLNKNTLQLIIINNSTNNTATLNNLFNYIGCSDYIINVDNPIVLFKYLEKEIKFHPDRFNRRKYVILFKYQQQKDYSKIFQLTEINYINDLIAITTEGMSEKDNCFWINNKILKNCMQTFLIWTHRYVGSSSNNNNQVYIIDKWFSNNESFLYGNNLFPNKLLNQNGRSLRAAIFTYEPYVIIEPRNNAKDKYLMLGSEMEILLNFAQHHNMNLIPVIIDDDYYWGRIWNNWTGQGLLGSLVEDNADIGAAALYTWEFAYEYLDLSKPTVRTGITCLVPAPKLFPGWLIPVYAFAPEIWIAVGITFSLSILTLYLAANLQTGISKNKRKLTLFANAFASVFKPLIMQDVTSKEMVKGALGTYLMSLVFLITLILSSTYNSGLASIMTVPKYHRPIDTIEEFANSGLFWVASADAWILSIKSAKEPNLIEIVSRFKVLSEENLTRAALERNFAFSIERLPKDNFAIGSYIKEDTMNHFHLMKSDFYWEFCVLMMRKNSILLPYVDKFVLRAFETGLISIWQDQAVRKYMNQKVQTEAKNLNKKKNPEIIKLQITHVEGAFGILLVGYIIACLVWIGEFIYYKI